MQELKIHNVLLHYWEFLNAMKDFGLKKISSFPGPRCIIRELRKVLRKVDVVCYHPIFHSVFGKYFLLFLYKLF